MRRAGRPIGIPGDMLQSAALVGAIKEADFAVFVAGVVKVDQQINVATVSMLVERPILVHGERVTGFGRLDVHGTMMKLDPRA